MRVLVVAAHPDDELLGVGGTIAHHICKGDQMKVAVMCKSRSLRSSPDSSEEVSRQAHEAAGILGVSDLVMGELPDQRLDTLSLTDVSLPIEQLVEEWKPEIIYTHFTGDINRDHRILSEAVLVAARPYAAPFVREILMFETPSSTEWSTPNLTTPFLPNVYVDISAYLDRKVTAFSRYTAELRDAPHPRSLTALTDRAHYWGSLINRAAAEPFVLVRSTR
jgi:LmbE family N-acetylglucosaminyl deacetylase